MAIYVCMIPSCPLATNPNSVRLLRLRTYFFYNCDQFFVVIIIIIKKLKLNLKAFFVNFYTAQLCFFERGSSNRTRKDGRDVKIYKKLCK